MNIATETRPAAKVECNTPTQQITVLNSGGPRRTYKERISASPLARLRQNLSALCFSKLSSMLFDYCDHTVFVTFAVLSSTSQISIAKCSCPNGNPHPFLNFCAATKREKERERLQCFSQPASLITYRRRQMSNLEGIKTV